MTSEYDFKLKLILVGDTNVGKSSFFNILRNEDPMMTSSTVGVDFTSKLYNINNKKIKITMWDTGGQEKFECIVRSYFRQLSGVVLMFDLTLKSSFDNLEKWLELIDFEFNHDKWGAIYVLFKKKSLNSSFINKEVYPMISENIIINTYKDFQNGIKIAKIIVLKV